MYVRTGKSNVFAEERRPSEWEGALSTAREALQLARNEPTGCGPCTEAPPENSSTDGLSEYGQIRTCCFSDRLLAVVAGMTATGMRTAHSRIDTMLISSCQPGSALAAPAHHNLPPSLLHGRDARGNSMPRPSLPRCIEHFRNALRLFRAAKCGFYSTPAIQSHSPGPRRGKNT